jgi:hypothetical protein
MGRPIVADPAFGQIRESLALPVYSVEHERQLSPGSGLPRASVFLARQESIHHAPGVFQPPARKFPSNYLARFYGRSIPSF